MLLLHQRKIDVVLSVSLRRSLQRREREKEKERERRGGEREIESWE